MKTAQDRAGKISNHFQGLGTVTREMVERRAKELAIINGRAPNDFTENDWTQAKHEMLGDENFDAGEEESVAAVTRWDEEPGTSGHQVEKFSPPDEQTFAERLVEEGVEEAEHDQMVEGSRKPDERI